MNRRVRGWGRSPISRMWDRWVRRTWSARASGSLDKQQTVDPSVVQPDKIRPAVTESLPYFSPITERDMGNGLIF